MRVRICFTFVFHRYFIMDSWRLACVCVYVCAHVHISVYCLCGRVEGGVKWQDESKERVLLVLFSVAGVCAGLLPPRLGIFVYRVSLH